MEPIKTDIAGIFEPTRQHIIPLFQRHYVWGEEEQWNPLWEDIKDKAAKRADGESGRGALRHFTGAIVVQNKPTNQNEVPAYEIIDGQQRLTTFQAILCALRDVCRETGGDFEGVAADAEKYILNTGSEVRGDDEFKLLPTEYDRPAFKAMVRGEELPGDNRIANAYRYFKDRIQSFVDGDVNKARAMRHTIAGDFGMVSIRINNEDEPELIFESLNARGKPLLQFDLLRNNLFLRTRQSAGEDRDTLYSRYWRHFESGKWEQEISVGRRKIALSELFLQHFLSSRLATSNVEPLFHTYQKKYRMMLDAGAQTTEHELAEIRRYSEAYEEIIVPRDDSTTGAMQICHFLDITTMRPFMLYLLAEVNLTGARLRHILHAVESYILRREICTSQKSKNFNKFFPEVIGRLRKEQFSVERLLQILKDEEGESRKWPSDRDALLALSGDWKVNDSVRRYILQCIEWRMRRRDRFNEGDHPSGERKLTLEHIMPQKWWTRWKLPSVKGAVIWKDIISAEYKRVNPNWNDDDSDFPPEESEEYALADKAYKNSLAVARERDNMMWSIGNLTLLTQPLNSSQSNAPFVEENGEEGKKAAMEKHSSLILNKEICRETEWDVKQIKDRTKRLYGIFCKIWPDAQWFLDNIPPE